MGLLDIFKKKKTSDKPKEQQRFSQSSPSNLTKSNITVIDVAETAKINHPIYVKQINESTEIIRTTINPEIFFYRYKFAIERLTELEEMRKYIKLTCNPLEIKQNLINDKDKYITLLINRMLKKTEEKIITLKQQNAIENNINKFLSSVVDFSDEMGEQSKKYFKEVTEYLKAEYIKNTSDNMKIETVVINDETDKEQQAQENQSVPSEARTDLNITYTQKFNVNLKIETHDNSGSYWEDRFKEIKKLTEKSYPSRNGLKIPEIMVLDYAETFTTNMTADNLYSFWYYQYGLELEDIHNILNVLLRKKFIETAPAKEMIKKFTVAKIKELLKELELKQTGRKAELLDRLFENASSEYLAGKVTEKGFILTDTGKQELKENDYVIYFHKKNQFYGLHFDVWEMNKLLHDNPDKYYREIMWEEFQKQYNIEAHEVRIRGYKTYTAICNDICTFLLEAEGNAEVALNFFAEAVYYEVNYNMLKQYNLHIGFYQSRLEQAESQKQEFTEPPPEIYDFIYIDEKNLNKLKNELDISDNELISRLNEKFSDFHVEKTLLSDIKTAEFAIAKARKNYEILDKMEYIIDDCIV